jgi:hypothetical protein
MAVELDVEQTLELSSNWKFDGPDSDGVTTMNFRTIGRTGKMRIQIANTPAKADAWIQKFVIDRKVKELGFDIEWKPNWQRGQAERKASLLQLAARDEVLLVQMIHLKPAATPPLLAQVLCDARIRKAGVGILQDAKKMAKDWKSPVEGLVDISDELKSRQCPDAGTPTPKGDSISLARASAKVLGIDMCKRKPVVMSNWEARSLSQAQILYAALDAWVGR